MNNTITGPGGTKYTVIAALALGSIGIAALGDDRVRVRAQVTDTSLQFPSGWTTPSISNPRFSTVVANTPEAVSGAVAVAAAILGGGSFEEPKAPFVHNGMTLSFEEAQALADKLDDYLNS